MHAIYRDGLPVYWTEYGPNHVCPYPATVLHVWDGSRWGAQHFTIHTAKRADAQDVVEYWNRRSRQSVANSPLATISHHYQIVYPFTES